MWLVPWRSDLWNLKDTPFSEALQKPPWEGTSAASWVTFVFHVWRCGVFSRTRRRTAGPSLSLWRPCSPGAGASSASKNQTQPASATSPGGSHLPVRSAQCSSDRGAATSLTQWKSNINILLLKLKYKNYNNLLTKTNCCRKFDLSPVCEKKKQNGEKDEYEVIMQTIFGILFKIKYFCLTNWKERLIVYSLKKGKKWEKIF